MQDQSPIKQDNSIDLVLLVKSIDRTNAALKGRELNDDHRKRLQHWWENRRDRIKEQFERMSREAQSDPSQHFRYLMAAFLFAPSPSSVEIIELKGAFESYVREIERRVSKEVSDPEGSTRVPQENPRYIQIIRDQIKDVRKVEQEIQEVLTAWKMLPSLFGEDILVEFRGLLSRLESPQDKISKLARDLLETQNAVRFIDRILYTAYRTNNQELWRLIDRRIRVFSDKVEQKPGVPLPRHVSFAWVRDAYDRLKREREDLESLVSTIVAAVTWQYIEANGDMLCPTDVHSAHSEVKLSDKTWAECFVSTQRQKHPFLQESLLEYAYEQWKEIPARSKVKEFEIYTKEVDIAIQREIVNQIARNNPAFSEMDSQALDDYLRKSNERIERVRNALFSIKEGVKEDDESQIYFTRLMDLRQRVAEQVRAGAFASARALCEKEINYSLSEEPFTEDLVTDEHDTSLLKPYTPQTLQEALNILESLLVYIQKNEDIGILHWFRIFVRNEKERIRDEINQVQDLLQSISNIEEKFLQNRDETNRYFAQYISLRESWKRYLPGPRDQLTKMKNGIESAFCECLTLCPQAPWVIATKKRIMVECDPLPLNTWMEQFLPLRKSSPT